MKLAIKDRDRYLGILIGLKPAASKLFLYLSLHNKFLVPFKMTYWEISQKTKIKNPHLAMKELVEAGLVEKTVKNNNSATFKVLVDLVQF